MTTYLAHITILFIQSSLHFFCPIWAASSSKQKPSDPLPIYSTEGKGTIILICLKILLKKLWFVINNNFISDV